MKKHILIAVILVSLSSWSFAQVFNTSETLRSGQLSAGFEPSVYVNGDTDFNLFLHGGVGLVKGVDLGLKLGVMGNEAYLGGDVEFAVLNRLSLAAGAHSYGVFGLDFTGLYTFSLGQSASFYTGLDVDLNFPEDDDMSAPLWIPVGLELPIRKYMLFLFEAEINVTDVGSHFIGGGLNFTFN
jgi:hypothetical protein